MHAQNGSGFDTWKILNNLDCDKRIVDVIGNGKSIIELKVLNGFIERNNRQIPQNLHFRCEMTHLNYSLKKTRKDIEITEIIIENRNES